MNDDEWKILTRVGDGCLAGVLAAVILLIYLLSTLGCASTCPPPRVETVEVQVPVYSCPPAQESPLLSLPEYPDVPSLTAPDDDWKDWFAQVVRTYRIRNQALLDQIDYLESVLEEYRKPQ